MHPDAGAVIGISLAGSVLLVALIFLCLMNLPCCKETLKPRAGNRPRNVRPSASSQAAILSLPFSGSTRSLHTLSALDLHNQNQSGYFNGSSGLVNPLWQMQCHSCEMLATASQHNLNHHHPCSNSILCHCYHHQLNDEVNRNNGVGSSTTGAGHSPNTQINTFSNFQYGAPQLLPSAESPPPPYSPSRFTESRPESNNIPEEERITIAASSNIQSTTQRSSCLPSYSKCQEEANV